MLFAKLVRNFSSSLIGTPYHLCILTLLSQTISIPLLSIKITVNLLGDLPLFRDAQKCIKKNYTTLHTNDSKQTVPT